MRRCPGGGGRFIAMDKAAVLKRLQETGLVPVLRAASVEKAMALAEAVAAGGVDVLEVTMTVPGAVEVIARLVQGAAGDPGGGGDGAGSGDGVSDALGRGRSLW